MKSLLPLKRFVGEIIGINSLKSITRQHDNRLNNIEILLKDLSFFTKNNSNREDMQTVRKHVADRFIKGHGIEIGALTSPLVIPEDSHVQYVEKYSFEELEKQYSIMNLDFSIEIDSLVKPDIFDDAETLAKLGDNTQDFVIANHVLEHLENPIKAFKNILRVAKFDGIVYVALPDMRRCFDRYRSPTSWDHILQDYDQGPAWSKDQAYHEFAQIFFREGVDKGLLPQVNDGDRETQIREIEEQLKQAGFSIHFHAWTPDGMLQMFLKIKEHYNLPFEISLIQKNQDEVIFIFRKTIPG